MIKKALKAAVKGAYSLTTIGMETGFHPVRYQMYKRIGEVMNKTPFVGPKVLNISETPDSDELIAILGRNNQLDILATGWPEYDMLNLHQIEDNTFDYVLADQVLEHVAGSPQKAMDECHRVLRPGGIVIQTTCFFNELHMEPADYWRFTPHGLRLLSEKFSEVIEVGGWGNRAVFTLGLRYIPVPHAKWHPINKIATMNDRTAPISVWVIARK